MKNTFNVAIGVGFYLAASGGPNDPVTHWQAMSAIGFAVLIHGVWAAFEYYEKKRTVRSAWIAAHGDTGSLDARYVILQADHPADSPPNGLVWKRVTISTR